MSRDPDNNQTLIAATNGPVVEADSTGLVLRLSDRVIRDIARRLPRPPFGTPAVPAGEPAALVPAERLDAGLLGDIDAWDLQREGDWLRFVAHRPGAEGARRYRRHVAGGGVIAETPGPVLGLLSLGAGRRLTTFAGAPCFPHHVMACAPPDEGEPDLPVTGWRNRGADTMLADALLSLRHEAYRALPLIVAMPMPLPLGPLPSAAGPAMAGLDDQLRRLEELAGSLGKPARLACIGIEIGHDQAPVTAARFHADALAFMDLIAARLAPDLGTPRFLMVADAGPWWANDADANRAAIEGQHLLALRPGLHDLTVVAPSYMFAQDDLGQPTEAALLDRARIEAEALETLLRRKPWTCPILCLAERDDRRLRAVFKADGPLAIDASDPFGAGPAAGFALAGTAAGISGVEIAPDDPQSVLIHLDGPLEPLAGAQPRLDYAVGGPARGRGAAHPPACGALRDQWSLNRDGGTLRRWALPGSLVIR
ncbi:hypothetical protein [Paracoccus sp. MC1862]|uniref:hypothetical protein n=1 Tax=Paracoccus sp. MC1862 TaxID=2760307 RepID=UPI001600A33E|nr:hypothetical protein [Paracoccus sp. MC1862]MBB1499371.1 hypothetical protein [Paracoccus sp. MC1862]QQO44636.1 hypothetical protein JGR78_15050 [Paracoccus sp. MC1862]